ncbi:hypothetical protein CSX12_12090 [Microbacterium sp. Y-01]|uniref:DUF2510 domain-containing protein n=1 Tax=Microbacterium sp. Y-01 TaxID=2048898 RepID=UPI000F5F770A|nr:DUF2510 domain-containing protein [Microbacterium sp. Y-01]AZH79133.1 hypothetical protein CSX12_12090 [Microbacterium sp. Y-01]
MSTPAGWYDDGSGRQRWWDGQQWTEQYAPEAEAPSAEATPADDTAVTTSYPAPGDSASAPAYSAPAYPGSTPGYPGAYSAAPSDLAGAPYGQPAPEDPKKLSVLGLVGLGLAVLGTILVFIPVVGFVGFILLAAAFVVSIISLFLKGRKWPGIAGLVLSVVGTIIGVVMSFIYLFAFAQGVSEEIDRLPSSSPSIEASAPAETTGPDDVDQGVRPTAAEVAQGLTAIFATTGAEGYTEAQIACIADMFVASDLDNATLRTIAESDGTLTDVDAAYGFAEVLGDTEALAACFAA